MKNIFRAKNISKIFLVGFVLAFIACSSPQTPQMQVEKINENDLKLVLIKTNNIKFYDFGVLTTSPEVSLELFKLGKSIGKFVVKDREICFNDDCAPKWPASKSFFGQVGYDNLFQEILLKEDIFDGMGKQIAVNGILIQRFDYGGEEIYYERSENRVYFKNLTNDVTVSIENYK
ncbi:hypothetical protein CCY99_03100 [Helicobacter sp. 16-1353]|uniref:hypothetical protein n=1 Tax=Helicobacter sp. 16-1353 TaxID=2004996 RepID=UPI000DCB1EC9|nr:hypothetical protein [Helicobacter sp. 16-1353]RAX54759.1 hypothetical protein CCY99_03100 [Helicobacter sp. 16-1353]